MFSKKHILRTMYRAQKGKCCYCGRLCHPYANIKGFSVPKNAATLEHRFDKFDLRRLTDTPLPLKVRYAMACYNCNNKRGTSRNAQFNKSDKDILTYDLRLLLNYF
jgi:hypothetical protein